MNTNKANYFFIISLIIAAISLLISVAACSSSDATTALTSSAPSTPATSNPAGNGVTIDLTAQNMAFNTSTITVPSGASVTMNFNNKDTAPHNFALYTDSTASKSIFVGKNISSSSITYNFTAPASPGSYFFRCDVHPKSMIGTFVVQ
jgi:plastocyanin